MLTLSTPAAPRLRLTFLKAARMSSIVMRPVNECTFLLLTMVFLFCCILR